MKNSLRQVKLLPYPRPLAVNKSGPVEATSGRLPTLLPSLRFLTGHYAVISQPWASACPQSCVRFSPAPHSTSCFLLVPVLRKGRPWHTDTYPWGQAQPERQGPWAGTLRFSSCCSHVLSLLSSGSVRRSLQFTKTWPTGQAAAGRADGGCWEELGHSPGPGGGLLGGRGGQGDLGPSTREMQAEMGLWCFLMVRLLLRCPLGSQMHITGGGRDVCCHTTGQPPQLPVPITEHIFPTRYCSRHFTCIFVVNPANPFVRIPVRYS